MTRSAWMRCKHVADSPPPDCKPNYWNWNCWGKLAVYLGVCFSDWVLCKRNGQTTAPEFSSFGSLSFLIGLIKSSRGMPSHMASAAATNTDE